jgi:putative ABC transport system permease protein
VLDNRHEIHDVMRLAIRDYRHEWVMSGCFVLALAAVLSPLMVLFGLKYGIITSMFEPLIEDPRNREIRPVGSGRFGPAWFEAMSARPDVEFVVPRTRTIAATMAVRNPRAGRGRIITLELIPTAPGDPVLGERMAPLSGYEPVILSAGAAVKLNAAAGDRIEGTIGRTYHGEREQAKLPLAVAGVAPEGAFARDGLFVSLELLVAVEDFRDGRAVPALSWSGDDAPAGQRFYSGYRLYARTIDDVLPLRKHLTEQGLDVRTKAADIELVKSLDRSLGIVYWIIVGVAMTGYCLSLGASLWANVDRKRREFSVLRLIGFDTCGIVWFPVIQALVTGLLGWLLASCIYLAVEGAINALFSSSLASGQSVCVLLPRHFLATMVLTTAAAGMAAALSGLRVARIEPSDGLREI